ncbi:MAG: transposase [Hungatella sp.]|nr:transposase [Hungatella sp.]
MGAKDIVTKDYMNDARVFADAFNYLIFDGNPVIDPSKLHEMDTTEIGMPYGEGKTRVTVQKFRDGLKYLTAMEDENGAYLLLGIENQSEIHYAMAVKNMVYDALQYASQVERAAKSHREEAKKQKSPIEVTGGDEKADVRVEAGEYLSGFYKGDRLVPVITLTLLFNPEPWDAPMSIYDMLSVRDPRILSFVPDYRINLIAPAQIREEDMEKFRSSLREVMLYIKYSKDREQLDRILESDPRFRNLDVEAAVVINRVTNSGLKISRKEKTVNMCQAVADMRKKERQEGRREGRQEGRQEGERKATARINKLNSILIAAQRFDDLKRATKDVSYQKELMEELLVDEE